MKIKPCLFVLFALLLGIQNCWSRSTPVKVIYENNQLAPDLRDSWKAETTEGASMRRVDQGIEFTLDVYKDGPQLWPRLWFLGTPIDLSEYSRVVAEIENASDTAQNLVLGVQSSGAGQAVVIPPRQTVEISVDISDGAPIDQSKVSEIMLYLYRPIVASTFTVKKVSAIQHPDFVPVRASLERQLAEAQNSFALLKQASDKAQAVDPKVGQAQSLLASISKKFADRPLGYVSEVRQELREAQQIIARAGMEMRRIDLWVWSSPLALAMHEGVLPSPSDGALKQIKNRVALGQYKAICVNVSAAAKAQNVTVSLNNTKNKSLFSLRPTLFAKARDGSQTADAVGAATDSLKLEIAPFGTQQVLVWINTKTPGLKAGRYKSSLAIEVEGDKTLSRRIPLDIEIADVRLASQLPISVHNWAYFYLGSVPVSKGLEPETVANARDYGINTWSFDYSQVPLPKLNEAGEYSGLDPATREAFEKALDLLKGKPHELFIVWLGFQRDEVRAALARPGVLQGYLKDVSALLDKYKIPKNKRYLTFWDEPKLPETLETLEWIKKVKAIDPSWKFYENGSAIPTDPKQIKEIARLTDHWLPDWDQLYVARPEEAKKVMQSGARHLGFYRCLMSRTNRGVNIYEYYRFMGWRMMEHGFDTLAFWVHNVGPNNGWDGTEGGASGGMVIYSKDGQLYSSRRWELFREGLEDYKLMQAAMGTTGVLDPKKHPALAALCREVTSRPNDFSRADATREKLIAMALAQTKSKKPQGKK